MTYYFAFVSTIDEAYDSGTHNVEDLNVRAFSISQERGEFARASILAENPGTSTLQSILNKFILISEDTTLLFRGRILGLPDSSGGAFVTLDAIAQPEDWQTTLRTQHNTLKVAPYWDDLFVSPNQRSDPTEGLDARPSFYDFNRATHALTVEDAVAGSVDVDLGGEIDADSLSLSIKEPPITTVNIDLTCNWVQSKSGRVRVDDEILRAFGTPNGGQMRTYTPDALLSSWPPENSGIGNSSGWSTLISNISLASRSTTTLTRDGDSGEETAEVTRFTFGTTLINGLTLQYNYRQARQEKASITVTAEHQQISGGNDREEDIDITLEDITTPTTAEWRPNTSYVIFDRVIIQGQERTCARTHTSPASISDYSDVFTFWGFVNDDLLTDDSTPLGNPARAAFFDTERGLEAIEHAIEIARTRIILSAQALEVSARGKWEDLSAIDCTSTIKIDSPFLPNGTVTGKVISYDLDVQENGVRWVNFTLGCSVGTGNSQASAATGTPDYVEVAYVENPYQSFTGSESTTDGSVVYSVTSDDLFQPLNAHRLSVPSYAIRSVSVENPANVQLDAMTDAWRGGQDAFGVEDAVIDKQTQIRINMRDLTAEDVITRNYTVTTQSFQTQKDIDLS